MMKTTVQSLSKQNTSNENLYEEIELRIAKKPNTVISGIPEVSNGSAESRKDSDKQYFTNLMHALNLQNVDFKDMHRIGKIIPTRNRLLRVSGLDLGKN